MRSPRRLPTPPLAHAAAALGTAHTGTRLSEAGAQGEEGEQKPQASLGIPIQDTGLKLAVPLQPWAALGPAFTHPT